MPAIKKTSCEKSCRVKTLDCVGRSVMAQCLRVEEAIKDKGPALIWLESHLTSQSSTGGNVVLSSFNYWLSVQAHHAQLQVLNSLAVD